MKTFSRVRAASGDKSLEAAVFGSSGQFVETQGYYNEGDGGGERYQILTSEEYNGIPDGEIDHQLSGGMVAKRVRGVVTHELSSTLNVQKLNGQGQSVYTLEGSDTPTIQVGDTVNISSHARLENITAEGDEVQPSNDNAVITADRCRESIFTGNIVTQGYNSFSAEYSDTPPDSGEERRSISNIVTSNIMTGSYMGFEMFSTAFTAFSGNVSSRAGKVQGTQHGLRITGYGPDHLSQGHDLRNRGNAYTGFASNNFANGVSLQTGSYGNIVEFAASDCLNGLQHTPNTTLADAISSSNIFTFAIDKCDYGAFLYDPKASSYRGTVRNADIGAWNTLVGDRQARSNSYDLTITESSGPARFADSYSRISVTVSDAEDGGVLCSGNFNIIDVVAEDLNKSGSADSALSVSGNNNIIRIVCDNVEQPFSEVIISGAGNHITMVGDTGNSEGLIAVTGTGNTIVGNCTITSASNVNNDYSGVYGYSQAGNYTATTDASGRFTLPLTVPQSAFSISMSPIDFTKHYNIVLTGQSLTTATFIVFDQIGAVVPSDTFNTRWSLVCFKV